MKLKGLFLPFYINNNKLCVKALNYYYFILFSCLVLVNKLNAEEEIYLKVYFRPDTSDYKRFENFRKSCLSKI